MHSVSRGTGIGKSASRVVLAIIALFALLLVSNRASFAQGDTDLYYVNFSDRTYLTTSAGEINSLVINQGGSYDGRVRIWSINTDPQPPGSASLYHLVKNGNDFYTTSGAELNSFITNGWQLLRVEGYVMVSSSRDRRFGVGRYLTPSGRYWYDGVGKPAPAGSVFQGTKFYVYPAF